MHPTTLMSCPRIHRRNRRRQTRTAIRDDQRQVLAFQPAAIQILEQAFPVGLTLSLTAQKRQQVTPAIAPHAVSHQHLYPLASRWTPHPQAHSIQEQVSIVIAQLGLVKLANRLVQIAGQFRDRLRAHHFAGQGGHYPPHLPRADPAQKMPPGSTARPPPPAAETVANHGAENSSREYAQPAAGWCRSGSQNPARSSRCDRLAVGHAAVRTAPSPHSDRVAAPTAARKTAARLASSARINRPRNSLSSPPENVGNAH